jgi:hypothetical protein
MTWIDRMRKKVIDITARHRITRGRQKHTNMKLMDWYDFVPAFVDTFGVLSISRTLGLQGAERAFDAGRPPAQTSISICSFDGTPKALQVLADHLAAAPTPRLVVAYVPAVTSVGEALRFLDLADEDYGWIQITVLPDSDHVVLARLNALLMKNSSQRRKRRYKYEY